MQPELHPWPLKVPYDLLMPISNDLQPEIRPLFPKNAKQICLYLLARGVVSTPYSDPYLHDDKTTFLVTIGKGRRFVTQLGTHL